MGSSNNPLNPIRSTRRGPKGESAYELAVEKGFRGTESEWLVSLKGQPGNNGQPGNDAQVTKENVENVLTGEITSHTHPGGSTGNSYFPAGW